MNASVTHVMAFGFGIAAVAARGMATGRPAEGSMAAMAANVSQITVKATFVTIPLSGVRRRSNI
jgi:hypothetical protein